MTITLEEMAAALGRHHSKRDGGEMACCPAHDDKNPSLSMNYGRDGKIIVNCLAGCSQGAVINALKARNLWPTGDTSAPLPPVRKAKAANKPESKVISPVPGDAPDPPTRHPRLGKPSMSWRYLSPSGELLQIVYRFDKENGKEVLPLTFCTDGKRREWRFKAHPEPRPLYGLNFLGDAKFVVVVEGEKAADAARRLFGPDLPVVTWSGGGNAVAKNDWQPLAGRNVAIWPDADEPGSKAALAVVQELVKVGAASVKITSPPKGGAR